jgi:hypothetical protein
MFSGGPTGVSGSQFRYDVVAECGIAELGAMIIGGSIFGTSGPISTVWNLTNMMAPYGIIVALITR